MGGKKLLIVGGVASGTKTAAKAKREDPDLKVTIITREKYVSYAGCGLPYFIGGVIVEEQELLVRRPEDFWADFGIEIITETEAVNIDPKAKKVAARDLKSGEIKEYNYDYLVLATGASPVKPPIPGIDLANIFTLRSLPDAVRIKSAAGNGRAKKAVVVGGGLIGLEVAENLARLGLKAAVVEASPQILPPYDPEVASYIQRHLLENGVDVFTGTSARAFMDNGRGEVAALLTTAGEIPCDLAVVSTGVRPNAELARAAGIRLGSSGAIAVNEEMKTSLEGIYAVGDCAENINLVSGRPAWYPMGSTANKMGRTAGQNIAGGEKDFFGGVLGTSIIKVFNVSAARTGLSEKEALALGYDVETVTVPSQDRAHYYPGSKPVITRLIVDRQSRRLLGGQIYGEGAVDKPVDILATAITFGATVDQLAKLDLAYAPPFSPALGPTTVAANVMLNKLAGKFCGISPLKLKERLKAGALLVDVRAPEEYFVRSIPGFTNIPLKELGERAGELGRGREIILTCRVGVRSYLASLKLKRLGFEKVSILEGGITAYPLETV